MAYVPFHVKTVGRRKAAIANLTLILGSGKIRVNGREIEEIFSHRPGRLLVIQRPFRISSTTAFDVTAKTIGGGLKSQIEALQVSIARSLTIVCPETRQLFRKHQLITHDSRKKERRKYGLKKARKASQFSKR